MREIKKLLCGFKLGSPLEFFVERLYKLCCDYCGADRNSYECSKCDPNKAMERLVKYLVKEEVKPVWKIKLCGNFAQIAHFYVREDSKQKAKEIFKQIFPDWKQIVNPKYPHLGNAKEILVAKVPDRFVSGLIDKGVRIYD